MEVDAIKISKGDVNNVLLVEQAAKTKLPIILDAREKIDDVIRDIEICTSNNNDQIIIMHCPSGYPSEYSGVHLNAISSIKEKFHYPVGFADHSPGMLMNFAAVSIGANMLEVTITSDKTIEHAEHFMSLEPHELKPFVENIRKIENAMGDPDIINSSRVADSTRRHFIAKHDISQGDTITRENIDYQRPGNMGISVSDGLKIINKFAKIDIKKGSVLTWDMLD